MSETGGTDVREIRAEVAEVQARAEAARFDPTFLYDLRHERDSQANRWGDEHDRQHTLYDWTVFLSKFVGRAADAAMRGEHGEFDRLMVRVAALAAAARRANYPPQLLADEADAAASLARRLAGRDR